MPTSGFDATAVLGRRYGAFFIDAAICLIVFGVLFFATADTHTRAEMLAFPAVTSRPTTPHRWSATTAPSSP